MLHGLGQLSRQHALEILVQRSPLAEHRQPAIMSSIGTEMISSWSYIVYLVWLPSFRCRSWYSMFSQHAYECPLNMARSSICSITQFTSSGTGNGSGSWSTSKMLIRRFRLG